MIQRETSFTIKIPVSSDENVLECYPHEPSQEIPDSVESSKKRCRGTGFNWIDERQTHANLEAVVVHAANCNYGKFSSTTTEHRYRCKKIGCRFMNKYQLDTRSELFRSYHHGSHEHLKEVRESSPSRGLTTEQKDWVALSATHFNLT